MAVITTIKLVTDFIKQLPIDVLRAGRQACYLYLAKQGIGLIREFSPPVDAAMTACGAIDQCKREVYHLAAAAIGELLESTGLVVVLDGLIEVARMLPLEVLGPALKVAMPVVEVATKYADQLADGDIGGLIETSFEAGPAIAEQAIAQIWLSASGMIPAEMRQYLAPVSAALDAMPSLNIDPGAIIQEGVVYAITNPDKWFAAITTYIDDVAKPMLDALHAAGAISQDVFEFGGDIIGGIGSGLSDLGEAILDIF